MTHTSPQETLSWYQLPLATTPYIGYHKLDKRPHRSYLLKVIGMDPKGGVTTHPDIEAWINAKPGHAVPLETRRRRSSTKPYHVDLEICSYKRLTRKMMTTTDELRFPGEKERPRFTTPLFSAEYHTADLDASRIRRTISVYSDRLELEREVIPASNIVAVRLSQEEGWGTGERIHSIITLTLIGGGFRRWVLATAEAERLKQMVEAVLL